MSNHDFSNPSRQATKGLVLFFISSARKFFKAFWPMILVYVFKNKSVPEEMRIYIYLALGFLLLLVLTNAILSFYHYWFYIEKNEFVVKSGYLKKVKLSIPLERIQTINIKQNIWQQMLKVVALEIDTAGSAQKELKLVALTLAQAKALQEVLSVDKEQDEVEENVEHEKIASESKYKVFGLRPDELIKVALSENHLRNSLLLLALIFSFYNQLQDYFSEQYKISSDEVGEFVISQSFSMLGILIMAMLIGGFLFSFVVTFLIFYDFKFFKAKNEFIIQSGLFTKKSVTIPYPKIQVVSWITNPIKKLMGIVTITLAQASSGETKKKQRITIPGCNENNQQLINREIFKIEEEPVWDQYFTHQSYLFKIWFLRGWLPLIPVVFIGYENLVVMLLAGTWFLLSFIFSYMAVKKRYFKISEELIECSKGTIGQEFSRMYNFKVLCVKFKQSIFQRRRNLATIKIHTAGGKTLVMPFIEEELAIELYNYLLYKVESTNEPWM